MGERRGQAHPRAGHGLSASGRARPARAGAAGARQPFERRPLRKVRSYRTTLLSSGRKSAATAHAENRAKSRLGVLLVQGHARGTARDLYGMYDEEAVLGRYASHNVEPRRAAGAYAHWVGPLHNSVRSMRSPLRSLAALFGRCACRVRAARQLTTGPPGLGNARGQSRRAIFLVDTS